MGGGGGVIVEIVGCRCGWRLCMTGGEHGDWNLFVCVVGRHVSTCNTDVLLRMPTITP